MGNISLSDTPGTSIKTHSPHPDVEKQEDISIADQVIDFGKYKGQKFRDIKDDISYLEWLVSIDKISIEDFELLSTI